MADESGSREGTSPPQVGRELIDSLRQAVASAPGDVELRLHIAELLVDAGTPDEAVEHLAAALQLDPTSARARALMAHAIAAPPSAEPPSAVPPDAEQPRTEPPRAVPPAAETPADVAPTAGPGAAGEPVADDTPATGPASGPASGPGFDWRRAEADLRDVVPPMFVDHADDETDAPPEEVYEVERPTVTLADVGGLEPVKARLEAAFLAPLRNPELRRLFGKSLRGGLLLYGPPGCGKTFLARAVAGELGARFLTFSLTDVLDMYIGQSERNLHDLFDLARRSAPCVVFLDEIDAIGQKRSHLRSSAMRSTVNQLLHELDGVDTDNQGVFVLAATNTPWDVDVALRRPGRLDRTVLVSPPDTAAREAILRYHLEERPVAAIDLRKLAKRTDDFSGADLAHLCETAAERALLDSARTGTARMIEMRDFEAALDQVRPSTGPWFESARNVALFANDSGQYDELVAYLKSERLI